MPTLHKDAVSCGRIPWIPNIRRPSEGGLRAPTDTTPLPMAREPKFYLKRQWTFGRKELKYRPPHPVPLPHINADHTPIGPIHHPVSNPYRRSTHGRGDNQQFFCVPAVCKPIPRFWKRKKTRTNVSVSVSCLRFDRPLPGLGPPGIVTFVNFLMHLSFSLFCFVLQLYGDFLRFAV